MPEVTPANVVLPVVPPLLAAGPKPAANGIDPVDGTSIVSVSDLPAKAFAADKTPAAKATAPTPNNGFKAKADAIPATMAEALCAL